MRGVLLFFLLAAGAIALLAGAYFAVFGPWADAAVSFAIYAGAMGGGVYLATCP